VNPAIPMPTLSLTALGAAYARATPCPMLPPDRYSTLRPRGRNGGRKPTLTAAAVLQAQTMYDSGDYTVAQIAAAFKTTRTTICRDTIGKKIHQPNPANRRDDERRTHLGKHHRPGPRLVFLW
jgi:hypothetical protein